jgi:hypothetical protein
MLTRGTTKLGEIMKKHMLPILLAVVLAVSGYAWADTDQLKQLTPEQQQQLLQMLLRQMGQKDGAASQAAAPTSEETLAKALAGFPKLKTGVTFEKFKDGFGVNGTRYVDPEGLIVSYGFDVLTGDVTYLANVGDSKYVIKTTRALTNKSPVKIATAQRSNAGWQVETVTGQNLSGTMLIPTSKGFVIARDNTGFMYLAGEGTTNIVGPEDFSIAGFQNGDIAGTGHILFQRRKLAKTNSVGSLLSSFSSLGNTLGINKKEDYLLFNIATGKGIPLDVPLEGMEVARMSQCRQVNAVVNNCQHADFYDALFKPDGSPNTNHYYWRIQWYKTPTHPIVVAQEKGSQEISVTDLAMGKRVIAFSRSLGIASYFSRQGADGKVSITASWVFADHFQPDAAALLDKEPSQPTNQENKVQASGKEGGV